MWFTYFGKINEALSQMQLPDCCLQLWVNCTKNSSNSSSQTEAKDTGLYRAEKCPCSLLRATILEEEGGLFAASLTLSPALSCSQCNKNWRPVCGVTDTCN